VRTSDGRELSLTSTPERDSAITLADGRRLAWAEWGLVTGTPLILFQGMPGSSRYCPDVEATHDLGVRLISLDRPGYGESDSQPGRTVADWADDYRELLDALGLDALGLDAPPIVGWSSGVQFAMACAARLGDRVPALALVAGDGPIDEVPGAWDDTPPPRRQIIEEIRADPAAGRLAALERGRWYAEDPIAILGGEAAAPDPAAPADDDAEGAVADDPDAAIRRRPDGWAALAGMFRHGALQGAEGWIDDTVATYLPWGFSPADVRARTTVWYGAKDQLAQRRDSDYLARVIPGARLVIEPDDGHMLPVRHWRAILTDLIGAAA
jgi:pimeloyl-ACP methyl ester carboxylesterase